MTGRPTINSIAEMAGVSKRVVSVVMNGKENQKIFVSKEKKRRILELANEHGYVPMKSARDLVGKKTHTIGLVFHRLTPSFASLLETLQRAAFLKGLEVMPYVTDGSHEREKMFLEMFRDGRVDGVIVASSVEGTIERLEKYSSSPCNLKIVAINGKRIENVPTVHFDEKEAGRLAAEHMVSNGCENLCFFGGDAKTLRAEGFFETAERKTGKIPYAFTGETTCEFFEEAKTLAGDFLKQEQLPDGVFASNDLIGIALISELVRAGIKIPEEVSIVGCDNTEVCVYAYPSLTSIDTNNKQTAGFILEKLISLVEGNIAEASHTSIKPNLVERESTAAVPAVK